MGWCYCSSCAQPAILGIIEDVIGTGFAASAASTAFSGLTEAGGIYFGAELEGIAKAANIPVGKFALMQIAYEFFAACTLIIVDMSSK